MAKITKMPPKETDKKIRKTRPTTVYRQAVRTLRKAAELVSKIDGCDEVRAQLVEAAEAIGRKLELMKQAAQAAKKTEKADGKMSGPDEAQTEEPLG